MPKLTIDGQEVEVPPGSTVLQACEAAGREIPVFCYHPRLDIAGNCRMCLVEMEKSPKPIASCAMPAGDGMVIKTNTPLVHKARKGVLELLLINHPLDCPICDQGGECDLQDLTLFYGPDQSRFEENKRPVADKYLGPLISTHMTRCIHCTRCIRFIDQVAGVEELGAVHRGEHMEITTWIEKALSSELSGNIIDLCPVGALNSKPYEYRARTWELKKTESIDVLDAVGANIRVDSRGSEVMRVLPRLHEDINEEWLADKSRFSYDGLKRRRLDVPMVKSEGKLAPSDWRTAFSAIKDRLEGVDPGKIGFIVGDLVDAETMVMVRELAAAIGTPHVDCRQDGAKLDGKVRAEYLFNTTIAGIEQADAVLLVGTNPRWEAPLINARLRKRQLQGNFRVARIGAPFDLTYPVEDLGAGAQTLQELASGQHSFAEVLKSAKNPMVIVGAGAIARPDGAAIVALARELAVACNMVRDDWNGYNVLHTAASRVAGLDLGLVPGEGGRDVAGMLEGVAGGIEVLFLIGADEIDTSRLGDTFVVYQGHHGDVGAHAADVILPGAAYTEKNAIYVNTEGRPQRTKLAVFPPGEAKEDWKILRALSEVLGRVVQLNSLPEVRARLTALAPQLRAIDVIEPAAWGEFGRPGELGRAAFTSPVQDFYQTNPISRASAVMAECSELFVRGAAQGATGTHG
ncbi:NADH-quinone oxidoreductase subunit NuoG [Geminicoccaceae bacterium 1502E]|nr:NADH-quinone oxidoreductase subunit NuoG [Geminicoccaceae bacterium 1502E]